MQASSKAPAASGGKDIAGQEFQRRRGDDGVAVVCFVHMHSWGSMGMAVYVYRLMAVKT